MKKRKIPQTIKELIHEIERRESSVRTIWKELYAYLDELEVDSSCDMVAALQDGVGAEELIKWLEDGHQSDYD